MKITIISGSHREASQSIKVAKHIQTTLLEKQLCDDAEIFSWRVIRCRYGIRVYGRGSALERDPSAYE